MTLKIGIIGAGIMGADHAHILAEGISGAELAAIQDLDVGRARAVAKSCGGVKVHEDALALIADRTVDAVLIASPDPTHAPLTLACLDEGKPVLCEKPIAPTPAEGLKVVEAEARSGKRRIQIGFMRRFDPGYAAMREAVATEKMGRPLFMHNVHRNAIAPDYLNNDFILVNSTGHEMDITRFVLGEDIARVSVFSPRPSRKAPSRNPLLLILETASGVISDVEAFMDVQYGYDVRSELVCETGTLSLSVPAAVSRRTDNRDGTDLGPDWRGRFAEAYRRQMHAWVKSIHTGKPVGASAWDGYASAATAVACQEALKTGARVMVNLPAKPALYA